MHIKIISVLFFLLLLQQKMKMGPLVARVLKLFLHFHLVFTTGITFSYLVKVKSQDCGRSISYLWLRC